MTPTERVAKWRLANPEKYKEQLARRKTRLSVDKVLRKKNNESIRKSEAKARENLSDSYVRRALYSVYKKPFSEYTKEEIENKRDEISFHRRRRSLGIPFFMSLTRVPVKAGLMPTFREKSKVKATPLTKLCPSCSTTKPREAFGIRGNGYIKSHCKACEAKRIKNGYVMKGIFRIKEGQGGRVCSQCNTWKQLDAFGKNRSGPLGVTSWCKDCNKKIRRLKKENTKSKICSKCKIEKPLGEFYNNSSTKDGKHCQCISCIKANYAERMRSDPVYKQRKQEMGKRSRKKLAEKLGEEAHKAYWREYQRQYKLRKKFPKASYTCTSCKITKPASQFHNCTQTKSGKTHDCKDCRNARYKKLRETEKYREKRRLYFQSPKMKEAARKRMKKSIDELNDWYVKNSLIRDYNIARKDITPEMIEFKRATMQLGRLIKKAKNESD